MRRKKPQVFHILYNVLRNICIEGKTNLIVLCMVSHVSFLFVDILVVASSVCYYIQMTRMLYYDVVSLKV